jgi:hypothetical protein
MFLWTGRDGGSQMQEWPLGGQDPGRSAYPAGSDTPEPTFEPSRPSSIKAEPAAYSNSQSSGPVAGGQNDSDDSLFSLGVHSWGQPEFDRLRGDRGRALPCLRGEARQVGTHPLVCRLKLIATETLAIAGLVAFLWLLAMTFGAFSLG